ncbi:hypothetical protein QBC32DRAFT_317249 [Pseudoneurospora amorphoporcata]|uniref:Uncharacterized protein n=1 Tax=Pseudoneurospora amorphoporcata TaxID=241081 RepID=A0AAN6SCX3_9PEZI|nr:hypothetical protein QBC32DRAFT_317249 [Pseudoneurospora amorphoporcata]
MAYRPRLWTSPTKGYVADDEHTDNATDSDQQEDQSMSDVIPPLSENFSSDPSNSELSSPDQITPFEDDENDEDDEDSEDMEGDEQMEDSDLDAYADSDDYGDPNDYTLNELHPLIDIWKEAFIYVWLDNQPDDMSTPPESLGLGHDEDSLRERAIEWMEELYRDLPNGIVITPPPWYAYSRYFVGPDRPRAWIKDWTTGRVRPREKTDDLLVSLALVEQQRDKARSEEAE